MQTVRANDVLRILCE